MTSRIIKTAADRDQEWFDFPGMEERYEITWQGVVRSKSRYVNSPIAGGQRRIKGKLIALQDVKGYWGFKVRSADGHTTAYIHRAIAKLFVRNPYSKACVNHIDGNKKNNDPSNLEWCTHTENMRHAFTTGLIPYPQTGPGEESPSAKLNDENEQIRAEKTQIEQDCEVLKSEFAQFEKDKLRMEKASIMLDEILEHFPEVLEPAGA